MKALLLIALLALPDGRDPQSGRGFVEAYRRHLLRPEATARWEKEAARGCKNRSAECIPAFLAAKYTEAAMLVCRRTAEAEFAGKHGGTATTFAQHSIRRSCLASIEFCRSAWRNVDAINFRGTSSHTDPARVAHFEKFLTDLCGAKAGVAAPF